MTVPVALARRRTAEAAQREMEAAAARYAPRFRRMIRDGLAAVRASLTDARIDELWPDLAAIVDAAEWDLLLPMRKAADEEFVDDVLARTMAVAADRAWLASALSLTDPLVIAAARRLAGDMVTRVNATSRAAIRAAVTTSVSAELTRPELRSLIRSVVGLTPRQARAVANYTLALHRLAAGDTTAGAVASRFTLTPRLPARPTAAQIDRLAARYAERQLAHRARMIERTELLRASNAGRQAGWEQAVRDGLIPVTSRKVWRTVDDERRCPQCAPMDGQTVSLIGEPFRSDVRGVPGGTQTPIVPVLEMYPPLHPACRCTVDLEPA